MVRKLTYSGFSGGAFFMASVAAMVSASSRECGAVLWNGMWCGAGGHIDGERVSDWQVHTNMTRGPSTRHVQATTTTPQNLIPLPLGTYRCLGRNYLASIGVTASTNLFCWVYRWQLRGDHCHLLGWHSFHVRLPSEIDRLSLLYNSNEPSSTLFSALRSALAHSVLLAIPRPFLTRPRRSSKPSRMFLATQLSCPSPSHPMSQREIQRDIRRERD